MRLRTFAGLWIEDGATANGGPRPRPLALLAMLAVAGANGASRDQVIGVLWPDSPLERARHALSQTIYNMRRELGADVVLATPNLQLDSALISSDVADFQTAVRDKNWSEAVRLYRGPFLGGFYLAGAPEFERWMEAERTTLAADALRALEILARAATDGGRYSEAAANWRRLTELDPVSARFAISYIEALAAAGDRTTAFSHGRAYENLLKREFDAQPDAAVQRLMSRLRAAEPVPPAPGNSLEDVADVTQRDGTVAEPARVVVLAVSEASAARELPRRGTRPFRKAALIVASTVGLAATGTVAWRIAAAAVVREHRPILAVGRIRDLATATADPALRVVISSDMLATSLSRLQNVEVIAGSRMLELISPVADTSAAALSDAARRAGATELIEAELVPLPEHRLRLDIRRVDVGRGIVRAGYQISGIDRLALLDSATVLIAADLRVSPPVGSLAGVSTRSPAAFRMYEEGLRAYYQSNAIAASRLFRAALREDSSFAMAAYYAWRAAVSTSDTAAAALAERALEIASHASDRDGLLIRTQVGWVHNEPASVIAAESLAARYRHDPEALLRAAEVLPDLARASSLANQSISLDSAAGVLSMTICRLCEALHVLVDRYGWADSAAAAERTLRRWIVLRPDDANPWGLLADLLVGLGRRSEAEAALRRAVELGMPRGDMSGWNFAWSLRSDDLAAATAYCDAGLGAAEISDFTSARWYCTIALRMQGRYHDALELARDGRVPRANRIRKDVPGDRLLIAILNMETSRPLSAAADFLAMGIARANNSRNPPAWRARETVWALALSATAAVAGGDTLGARHLIDSIETIGARSLFARDPRLHHFVRGLLLSRAGEYEAAVRELRASIASATFGYTRANYELGRALLALHRPREAIPVVRAAIHGGIEGSGLYVTRTELHELVAQLFDAAGQGDSAAVHYRLVERAWRYADPFLKPRYETTRRWLVQNAAGEMRRD